MLSNRFQQSLNEKEPTEVKGWQKLTIRCSIYKGYTQLNKLHHTLRQKFYTCDLNFVDDCFEQDLVKTHNFECLLLDFMLRLKGGDP